MRARAAQRRMAAPLALPARVSRAAPIPLRAAVRRQELRAAERAVVQTASVAASIGQLRERARAPRHAALRQRQGRRVLCQKTVPVERACGAAGAAARPNLDGAEASALCRTGRRFWLACCTARDKPVGRTRCEDERGNERKDHDGRGSRYRCGRTLREGVGERAGGDHSPDSYGMQSSRLSQSSSACRARAGAGAAQAGPRGRGNC